MLQFITHNTDTSDFAPELDQISRVLEGGCHWVQLRKKGAPHALLTQAAVSAAALCRRYPGTVLIIDDDIEAALEAGASGVHLGKNDLPVDTARRIAPRPFIIGATANTFEDITKAVANGADYIGLGPLRYTATKQNLSPIIGPEGYASIMARCAGAGINIPVVAIGSVTLDDVVPLLGAGLTGVAVSSAIINSPDPALTTSRFVSLLSHPHKL